MILIDWQAKWIWNEGEESPRNQWWMFRKRFDITSREWGSAKLSITADSRYVLYINGKQVGRGPVRSWPSEQAFDTYEVGHLLKAGQENVISVLVMHFGTTNFCYVRGRGGLLAQLDILQNDKVLQSVRSDNSWKTAQYQAQDTRSPRISCQLPFTENIDGRLIEAEWVEVNYDDTRWKQAVEIGSVGMEPWTSLVPSEIPFLTEEPIQPTRVTSLKKVKGITWSTNIELRNHMQPESTNHANKVGFVGYIATIIRMESTAKVMLGFVYSTRNFGLCSIDGKHYHPHQFQAKGQEKYLELELTAGDHLFMMDVTDIDHGDGFHMGIDSEANVEIVSPIEHESPFITIGPFMTKEYINDEPHRNPFEKFRDPNSNDPIVRDFQGVLTISSIHELGRFKEWIRPIPLPLVSRADVFAHSIWNREEIATLVPTSFNQAIATAATPAIVPKYEDYDTQFIVDFGKEYSGFLEFEIEAAAGTVVDFYGFEYMNGDYRQEMYRMDNTLRYVTRNGYQKYISNVRRGLRYVMVTVRNMNSPVKIHRLRMIQSNYPVSEIGQFVSSDPLLNDIWEISRHTTKLCMEDTFVDCPTFEQTYWVGDSRNEALINYYLFGSLDIVKRCLKLVPPSKEVTPLYMSQVPSGWNNVIPNWTFFWAIACKEYYDQTEDIDFVQDMWQKVKYTLDYYLTHLNKDDLFSISAWNLLDWAPMDQPNEGVVAHQNMFLAKTLKEASTLADIAGDLQAKVDYEHAYSSLKAAINKALWSNEKNAYSDCIKRNGELSETYSMQTQVVAYVCDIADGEREEIIENYLVNPPIDFVQIGSPFISFFYYEALTKAGKHSFMLDDIRKNYGVMIEYGATTCWEMYPQRIGDEINPRNLTRSHCHAWSAAPGYFLGKYVLGVSSAAPGWKKVIINPQPGDLDWAKGAVPLPNGGVVQVEWRKNDKQFTLHVDAPEEVEIEIKAPVDYELILN
nr:family 78 glycoside hydrolase catalytic domain [Paenibacillus bovis]